MFVDLIIMENDTWNWKTQPPKLDWNSRIICPSCLESLKH